MDKTILEKYLCDGSLNSEDLKGIDWQNNIMTLGLVLGISEKGKVKSEIYMAIAKNPRLNSAFRVFSFMRLLEEIKEEAILITEKHKSDAADLILRFREISDQISILKHEVTTMKEHIGYVYTKTFTELISKCYFCIKIPLLAICGLKNQDLLMADTIIFQFTVGELEKLNQYENANKEEVLQILRKGWEIVKTQKDLKNEPMSFIIYNITFEILNSQIFIPEIKTIASFLLDLKENFSPKQKKYLIEKYKKICSTQRTEINSQLLEEYTQDIQKSNKDSPKVNEQEEILDNSFENSENEKKIVTESETKIDLEGINKNNKFEAKRLAKDTVNFLRTEIKFGRKVDVNIVVDKLKESSKFSKEWMYDELYYMSYHEKYYSKENALVWKLISKALSLANLLTSREKRDFNINIDYILDRVT
ncbi:hypothetical protein SteCoe_14680 [Stentor coeruleus]|uniref:Uncharacterized protein n=1 Tax=Stentor coeruleus TaxID=5963 RepID=A0A1R2C5I9_9CILI|nr:hypothetical protein SteCoe_14680 [Stentor coeruleus]